MSNTTDPTDVSQYGTQHGTQGENEQGTQPENQRNENDDLEQFGYKQELRRGLGFTSTMSAAFSYMSPTTGIFGVFAIGFGAVGGAMFWGWPIVFLGQLFVALGFAELASHYPLAGSVYQWTKFLSPRKSYSWFTGWIYVWAGALTTAAVIATMPLVLVPLLQKSGVTLSGSLGQQQAIAGATLVVCLLLNIFGVKFAAVVNNIGVAVELLALVVFAVLLAIFHQNHGLDVVTQTGGHGLSLGGMSIALFAGLWVMYGMDTASTLAEESHSPRTLAPRGVLVSLLGAFVTGGIFLIALLVAVPGGIGKAMADGVDPAQIIDATLSPALSTAYLVIVNIAVFVTCLAIMTAFIRLVFSMARDRQLPLSGRYSSVNPKLGTPVGACLVAAVLAGIFLLQYKSAAIVAIAATAMTYVACLMANLVLLRARARGWPTSSSPFRLRRWGLPVAIVAVGYEILMVINLFWPRAQTNPSPSQTDGALHLGLKVLDETPIGWTVFALVIVVGAGYYAVRRSRIPDLGPSSSARATTGTETETIGADR